MLRKWRDYLTILKSGAFDPAYYLLNYRDCRLADVDPLFHFVDHGWKEGRNPSSSFDTKFYLQTNTDVKQTGINPLIHYLHHGQSEGRLPQPYQTTRRTASQGRRRREARGPLYTWGKKIYWNIPAHWRHKSLQWAYKNLGFLFAGMPHYENWRHNRPSFQVNAQSNLLDLNSATPAQEVTGKIAIHLHLFYADLVKEFVQYLNNMPFPYDLYVSAASDDAYEASHRILVNLPFCQQVTIERVDNRGRDVAPIFCAFGGALGRYDYFAHLHTKKSLYNKGATAGWREYLCNSLFGSEDRIRKIFGLFQADETCGIIYPQNYLLLPYWANTWLANRGLGAAWCARLGISEIPHGYFDYPASSMFWVRGAALAPLYQAGLTLEDFPEEDRQTDGTLAHTLERLFVLCVRQQGLTPTVLQDEANPSWSPWRFDQYLNRTYDDLVQGFASPAVRMIGFDIFDTLLSRPLLNPETIKPIVARRVGGKDGQRYLEYRAIAEQQAREAKGADVGMDEIYTRLGHLAGFSETRLAEIRLIEEEVERGSLEPREGALDLFQDALGSGKPVVIISDMFLSGTMLETILREHGFEGWKALFVSSEVGLRKDMGQLYEHIRAHFALTPEQLLMVGDNERADVQIPIDMGAPVMHLLRPVELARGLPRFASLIAAHEQKRDMDAEITLGLVVRKNFSPLTFPTFDPDSLVPVTPYHLGYSLLGPFLVSFAEWALQTARADGIQRLYFLSREGKPIKAVYDCWVEGEENLPQSDYLVISRRAAGLAAITTLDDILHIAQTTYFPNKIEDFLYTRYGIRLSDARWEDLAQTTKMERTTIVSVQDRKIEHLLPLLQVLEGEILDRVKIEREALLEYVEARGLTLDDQQAVVDVGYGGSVQKYLNKLLPRKLHGYYQMTEDRAAKVTETYDVLLRGCFYEQVSSSSNMPVMFRYSFDLEKLLSTNEPQIEYYERGETGHVKGHFRSLLPEELVSADIRDQLLEGALAFARDARRVRRTMLPDFQPSRPTAQMLLEAFLGQKSQQETALMSQIVLDDYYCGRDLVS